MPTTLRPSQSRPRHLNRDAVALAALALTVVAAPQLLGGIYPWGIVAVAAAALGTLAIAVWKETRGLRWTVLCSAMLGALLWTVVQALPLPCSLVDHVAPRAAEELRGAHRMLGGAAPTWCTLSRDPAGTREEIVKGIAITAAFFAAFILARRGHGQSIYRAIAGSGIALALVSWVHAIAGATQVFGLYEPLEIRHQPFLSPLLNLNTLGGFLAMCLPILIASAFSDHRPRSTLLSSLAIGLVASCVFMTRSRGAVGAVFLGVALLALLGWYCWRAAGKAARPHPRRRLERAAAVAAIAAALAVAGYGWHSELAQEFRGGDYEKFDLIAIVMRFAAEEPWIGVGRGAFGSAFAAVHNTSNRFEYAENFVAQWAAEWGMPVAAALIAALAHAVLTAIRRGRSIERMAALAGLLTLAVQNLVDIGLELAGVAVVASTLLGASTTYAQPTESGRARRGLCSHAPLIFVAVGAAAVALLARPLFTDHVTYAAARLRALSTAGDRTQFRALIEREVEGHPSEPLFAILGASDALLHRDPAAGRWINRAMHLAPGWSAPHELAARWLWSAGRLDQARLELGAAMKRDPHAPLVLACAMAKVDPIAIVNVIPRGAARHALLESLSRCTSSDAMAEARVDDVIWAEFPNDADVALRRAQRALAAGDAQAALGVAAAATRASPRLLVQGTLLQARALVALRRAADAVTVLQKAQSVAPDAVPLVQEEARLQAERGDRAGTHAALTRLHGLSTGNAGDTASVFMLEATLERKLGNLGGTLRAYDQAYSITGDYAALSGIAGTAEELGDRQRAAWAYGVMCGLGGSGADACARRDRLLMRPQR